MTKFVLFLISVLAISSFPPWGFFAHRKINRMAVFCLPVDMIVFYKKNIEYLTEHAVDPDKRRYATRHEAVRHYIDIDHWGAYPFPEVPRRWSDALIKYSQVMVVTGRKDTLRLFNNRSVRFSAPSIMPFADGFGGESAGVPLVHYRHFFHRNILPRYYENDWVIDCDSLISLLRPLRLTLDCESAFAVDQFSEHGVLPYHLLRMQDRLKEAFIAGEEQRILQLSADFGHYLADAHVPLHTTKNYNGEMTGQVGIHAFWESRIPELFAEQHWDFFVGKAEYIDDPASFFWKIILDSHSQVDTLLAIERQLKASFPADKQFCYEERLERTIRTQCREYAAAYHDLLRGQVEERMRKAIHAIASCWYTAWVDAGQPDLRKLNQPVLTEQDQGRQTEEEILFRQGKIKGRAHR